MLVAAWSGTTFPAQLTTSYRSSAAAGLHSVLAISSDKFAGNKGIATQPVSHLASLVFSFPLDETIPAQVQRNTILLSFCWELQLDPGGFHL
jgi:hypothetical protein